MLEVYILLTIAGIGYVIGTAPLGGVTPSQQAAKAHQQVLRQALLQQTLPPPPNTENIYESKNIARAAWTEGRYVADMHRRSQDPSATGVVGNNYRLQTQQQSKTVRSQLAGIEMPVEEFGHTNMMPFFSGSVKQNVDPMANQTRLETFTGQTPLVCSKREVGPMFNPSESMCTPMQGSTDFYQGRIVVPMSRNNEVPEGMEPVMVGPGFGSGFSANPMRDDVMERNFVLPKSIDDLRVANNPKTVYSIPAIPGQGTVQRAVLPTLEKRMPETFFEQGPERMLPNTAPVERETMQAPVLMSDTNRMVTSAIDYTGIAGGGARESHMVADANVRDVRARLDPVGLLNLSGVHQGRGSEDDHGRSGAEWMVYSNERDNTVTQVRHGNVSSIVKALAAPVLDLVRPTRKLYTSETSGAGVLQAQIPSKATTYDPSLWVARTTIKETLNFDADHPNIAAPRRAGGAVYDPDEIVRITGRQTLPEEDTHRNMRTTAQKGTLYDPDETTRVTVKQTTHAAFDGNMDGRVGDRGGYLSTEVDAKRTQKQFLSQKEHMGDAYRGNADAYRVIDVDAPRTQRQFLADTEYGGCAKGNNETMSYDDAYNATMNIDRAEVMRGRDPTRVNAMLGVGKDTVNMSMSKTTCDAYDERGTLNMNRVVPVSPDQGEEGCVGGVVRVKKDAEENDRLDDSILSSLKDNPYALKRM
jgi:hypothetical protein